MANSPRLMAASRGVVVRIEGMQSPYGLALPAHALLDARRELL
jgi:hypothetical protein